jgi:hypothetical protein
MEKAKHKLEGKKVRRYLENSGTFDYAVIIKVKADFYEVQPALVLRSKEHWLQTDCELV